MPITLVHTLRTSSTNITGITPILIPIIQILLSRNTIAYPNRTITYNKTNNTITYTNNTTTNMNINSIGISTNINTLYYIQYLLKYQKPCMYLRAETYLQSFRVLLVPLCQKIPNCGLKLMIQKLRQTRQFHTGPQVTFISIQEKHCACLVPSLPPTVCVFSALDSTGWRSQDSGLLCGPQSEPLCLDLSSFYVNAIFFSPELMQPVA